MLTGKRTLVTGAARGLGRGFAEAMLKEGAKVYLCDVNHDLLSKTVEELKKTYGPDQVLHGTCDVSVERELQAMFRDAIKSLGGLDIVANNAGIMNESKLELMIQVNLTAMIRGSQLAMEYMDPDNGGNGGIIINTASVAGIVDFARIPVYCATKTGIIAYTSAIAKLPATIEKKIRLNCLCPSFVETDLFKIQPGQTLDYEYSKTNIESLPFIGVSTVADAFMEIIKNTEMQGECMVVRKSHDNLVYSLKKPMDLK